MMWHVQQRNVRMGYCTCERNVSTKLLWTIVQISSFLHTKVDCLIFKLSTFGDNYFYNQDKIGLFKMSE